jgi:Uncharacterized protein conserved in bacteria
MGVTLAGAYYRSPLHRLALRGAAPEDLGFVFPSPALGDPEQAEAIVDGSFLLAGRRVPFAKQPWSVLPPGPSIARAMLAFAWLSDLRAAGNAAARERARDLVGGWIDSNKRWTTPAWEPPVLGRRVASWLAAGDFLLTGATPGFKRKFLESVGMQARHLSRFGSCPPADPQVLPVVVGRIAAALCIRTGDLSSALAELGRVLDRQILADGGHVSRNPMTHLAMLRDLIDVRSALMATEHPLPPALVDAIERMAPILRGFRHADGRLALFHGAKELSRSLIDTILVASSTVERPPVGMPDSRFTRLAAGRTLIIADVGPPPLPFQYRGHAGLLAFEMSDGRNRVVVNCGGFLGDDAHWRDALRSTAAHSTLTVDETNAAELADRMWRRARRPRLEAERRETDGNVWLDARHDGYAPRFGLTHVRRIYMDATGCDVRGEDALEGRRNRRRSHRYAVRFHLHPDVLAAASDDGRSVTLKTPGGGWRFMAVGGTVSIEDSTYLGRSDLPQKSRQIVVAAVDSGDETRVKWAFKRQGGV